MLDSKSMKISKRCNKQAGNNIKDVLEKEVKEGVRRGPRDHLLKVRHIISLFPLSRSQKVTVFLFNESFGTEKFINT